MKNDPFWTKLRLKKKLKRNLWNSKVQKEKEENRRVILSWMVDYNALFGILKFIFADFHIVVYHLSKRILKGYSFDWNVNFFPPVYEKIRERKERNEVEENRKGSWKVCLLLWNSFFFLDFFLCWFHTFAWGVRFLSTWFRKKRGKK